MEIFIAIAATLFVFRSFLKIKKRVDWFLENHEIVVVDKEDVVRNPTIPKDALSLRPENYDRSIDLRGTPTHLCPCGSNIWNVKVIFDNYEIATYFLDMECVSCGSVATAPTPVDKMGNE